MPNSRAAAASVAMAGHKSPTKLPELKGPGTAPTGGQKKTPLETPNTDNLNLKPIKTVHRPSRTPTGLPGDEAKPLKRNRTRLGELVDTLLVPEHKAARRFVRRSLGRRGDSDTMAAKTGMTLYERIIAYRKLKSQGEGSQDGEVTVVEVLLYARGWGSIDISQYTNGPDDKRSPTPQPTFTEVRRQ
ncbi:hypothetical protein PoB_001621200, partial [Plakobranchus ocellatus]